MISTTEAVDRQGRWFHSYLHAMNGYKRSRSYSIYLANHHVKTGFGMARYYINRGDGRNAYSTLGWTLHTLQDSTSPAHKYFQIWHGQMPGDPVSGAHGGSRDWYRHVRQESSKSQLNNGIYNATRYVWHMFYYRLVPTSNVFIF